MVDARKALGDARAVGGVGDIGRAVLQLEHQPVVNGVQRSFERFSDAAGPATLSLGVVDRQLLVDLQRRAVHLITQSHALFERGHQSEDFERGAGRQTGLGKVEAGRIRTAVIRLHAAGAGVD